jgi:hypothetical protein
MHFTLRGGQMLYWPHMRNRWSFLAPIAILALGVVWTFSASASTPQEYAEYTNDRWHYALAVPADMTVSEYKYEGDGQTAQFIDGDGNYEFQVSAWRYSQLDLTLGSEGAPALTADQPDHLEIVDVVRDDTFTVLFQKNGIRYVVVALPEHEAWLTDILTTWRFID